MLTPLGLYHCRFSIQDSWIVLPLVLFSHKQLNYIKSVLLLPVLSLCIVFLCGNNHSAPFCILLKSKEKTLNIVFMLMVYSHFITHVLCSTSTFFIMTWNRVVLKLSPDIYHFICSLISFIFGWLSFVLNQISTSHSEIHVYEFSAVTLTPPVISTMNLTLTLRFHSHNKYISITSIYWKFLSIL